MLPVPVLEKIVSHNYADAALKSALLSGNDNTAADPEIIVCIRNLSNVFGNVIF